MSFNYIAMRYRVVTINKDGNRNMPRKELVMKKFALVLVILGSSLNAHAAKLFVSIQSVHDGRIQRIVSAEQKAKSQKILAQVAASDKLNAQVLASTQSQFLNDLSAELNSSVAGIEIHMQEPAKMAFYVALKNATTCLSIVRLGSLFIHGDAYCTDGTNQFDFSKRYEK